MLPSDVDPTADDLSPDQRAIEALEERLRNRDEKVAVLRAQLERRNTLHSEAVEELVELREKMRAIKALLGGEHG